MENKEFKNAINEIRNLVMTESEKKLLLDNILKVASQKKEPVRSYWSSFTFIAVLHKKQLVYFILIPLIFILSGGGVVFASQDSLPDNILYPLKVNVLEPIEGALAFSPKSKAQHEISLAQKRLVEAETLAAQGKLDNKTENKINNLLSNHTVALNKALQNINTINKENDVAEITTNFRAEMNAHAQILDTITKKEDSFTVSNSDHINTANDNVNKADRRNNDTQISETARFSANKIKDVLDRQGAKSPDNFSKRKNSIESLINNTDNLLNNSSNATSGKDIKVVNDAQNTINEAKKYLYEADIKSNDGNSKEAYSSLLDSESSAKEANILLKVGAKLIDRNNHKK